jgi:type I restriction enzyme S subunit
MGTKMVNMGELFAHRRLKNVPMDRVPLTEPERQRGFLLAEGDLLFARQSLVLAGAGQCSIFLGDEDPVTFESHVIRVRLDRSRAHPLFYFYYLQSPH